MSQKLYICIYIYSFFVFMICSYRYTWILEMTFKPPTSKISGTLRLPKI